ncbi:MAG: hypothetical protein ACK5HY_06295, partial [Parahaliea sp.]
LDYRRYECDKVELILPSRLENKGVESSTTRNSAVTECYQKPIEFPATATQRRKVEADFSGGNITSMRGLACLPKSIDK